MRTILAILLFSFIACAAGDELRIVRRDLPKTCEDLLAQDVRHLQQTFILMFTILKLLNLLHNHQLVFLQSSIYISDQVLNLLFQIGDCIL